MEENKNEDRIQEEMDEKVQISEPKQDGSRTYTIRDKVKKNKPSNRGLIIFGVIVLAIVILAVSCNNMASTMFSGTMNIGEPDVKLPETPYIGTIYVEGEIGAGSTDYLGMPFGYQHEWTLNQIDKLKADQNNKGLIIFVDSPGGGVYESDELYLKIKEYQDFTDRPVYAYFGSMAASGGYYVSASADKIIANRNCWTGSIGVTIGTLFDFSQLLENYGVKSETITSGANKAMGSSFDELTEEQKAIFQSLIDEAYDQFTGIVSEEREMDIETVRKIADGRIYTAKQALENGLIDDISSFDDAKADMISVNGLEDCEIVDLEYTSNTFLGTLLGSLNIKKYGEAGDLNLIMKIVEDGNNYPVSYMCEALK